MKDLLIIANLKMTMVRRRDVVAYCDQLRKGLAHMSELKKGVQLVVCPSAPHYEPVQRAMHIEPRIAVGAQDVFWERHGSYTGQISPVTLEDSEVSYALVGHSEQRRFGHVTDSEISKKIAALLNVGITPVIFIGETEEERERGHMKDALTFHINTITRTVRPEDITRCAFVYEPVWAIGGTVTPTAEEIMSARILMQKILTDTYGAHRVRAIPFLYGGSVTPENAIMFTQDIGIRGVVLGRSGRNVRSFLQIAATLNHNLNKEN